MESYVQPDPCVQYVELAGTVGLFVKLDTMLLDEISLENFFHSFQHQVGGPSLCWTQCSLTKSA
jgi:hypothetical protein